MVDSNPPERGRPLYPNRFTRDAIMHRVNKHITNIEADPNKGRIETRERTLAVEGHRYETVERHVIEMYGSLVARRTEFTPQQGETFRRGERQTVLEEELFGGGNNGQSANVGYILYKKDDGTTEKVFHLKLGMREALDISETDLVPFSSQEQAEIARTVGIELPE